MLATGLLLAGCATVGTRDTRPLRLSELEGSGDATRNASMRLVTRGLGEEERSPRSAVVQYERAIQIDATNPYAYLALARHYAASDPDRALEYLDQAEVMLESEDALSPRVEPHLLGIRGEALRARGETARGKELLARAGTLAPEAWGDGRLEPYELK